jgi:hypothetical protein
MIAGAKTIAATPSLRRHAEIGRPLFASASAILAVMLLCPVRCIASEYNSVTPYPWSKRGSPLKIQPGLICQKKDEWCD